MADTRLPASGNIRLRWHADGAFANPRYPQVAELNAGLDLADSTSWNDFSFGVTGSNTLNDPALSAKSNTSDRGATQYGGSISFYFPRDFSDNSNPHKLVFDAMSTIRTVGYISMSIDGELSETNTPLYAGGATRDYASGDYVHIFKVMSTAESDMITGEDAFRYTLTFSPQGIAETNTVVGAGAAVVAITASDETPAPDSIVVLTATVNGRPYTRGLRWSSSDTSVATVSQNGVVTIVGEATDTVEITATFEQSGASDTIELTVTA